jgi:alkanesulfonate monooxygenase SsuD/methylene tetrahydromethanopterin reductase-like flavin-dependent oxidoreductase (luciferase family)
MTCSLPSVQSRRLAGTWKVECRAQEDGLMRFGTYFFLQAPPGRAASQILADEVEQMLLSESLGYDSLYLTEHHFSDYGLSAAPSVLLSHVAARTSRIQLGMGVYVLPFHHPLRLAEETATLDILSGGRLTVGLGRGNRPVEYVGHGVKREAGRTLMEEGVEILVQAWCQERVTFNGQHWQIPGIPVYPKPLRQPHPPLAFAVGSDESLRWAGRQGFAIMSSGLTRPLSTNLEARSVYETALRESGHADEAVRDLLSRWVVTKHVYVAPNDFEARADAEGPERWYLDAFARSIGPRGLPGLSEAAFQEAAVAEQRSRETSWEELVDDCLLVGSPATVRRQVAELAAAGVGELLCWMNFGGIPPDKARRSMRLFAKEVMPAFRRAPHAVRA